MNDKLIIMSDNLACQKNQTYKMLELINFVYFICIMSHSNLNQQESRKIKQH